MCCLCPSDLCPVAPWGCGNPPSQSWQKRLKAEFVLCIQDPLYTDGWGRRWLCSPHGQGCSDFSGPHHPSKPQTCTHTHTLGKGFPGGWGTREGEESVCLPKTMSEFWGETTKPRSVLLPSSSGEHRGAKCPLPHVQIQPPRHSTECPECSASTLSTEFLLSVNQSPPHGTADRDGGMWLRWVL